MSALGTHVSHFGDLVGKARDTPGPSRESRPTVALGLLVTLRIGRRSRTSKLGRCWYLSFFAYRYDLWSAALPEKYILISSVSAWNKTPTLWTRSQTRQHSKAP